MKRSLSSLITDTNVREFKAIEIKIESIQESSSQARTEFDDIKLDELADSIRKNGILQPLIVQEIGENQYELIAGERRLRASKLANLQKIPCLIKDVSSRDAAVIGLVENIQRAQLNAIDESIGFKHLSEKHNLDPKEIGLLVGKSRSYVSNSLRLSKLSDKAINALKSNQVSLGQIRPLINLSREVQEQILDEIIHLNLSSRQVENKVRDLNSSEPSSDETTLFYKNYFGYKPLFGWSYSKSGPRFRISAKNRSGFRIWIDFSIKLLPDPIWTSFESKIIRNHLK